jgi:hypothetical protein
LSLVTLLFSSLLFSSLVIATVIDKIAPRGRKSKAACNVCFYRPKYCLEVTEECVEKLSSSVSGIREHGRSSGEPMVHACNGKFLATQQPLREKIVFFQWPQQGVGNLGKE